MKPWRSNNNTHLKDGTVKKNVWTRIIFPLIFCFLVKNEKQGLTERKDKILILTELLYSLRVSTN